MIICQASHKVGTFECFKHLVDEFQNYVYNKKLIMEVVEAISRKITDFIKKKCHRLVKNIFIFKFCNFYYLFS